MITLYLTQPGSVLHTRGGRYQVEKAGEILADVPNQQIDEVLLYGGTQATSQALRDCLTRGTRVHLMTGYGAYLGRLEPILQTHVDRLRALVRQTDNEAFSLEVARSIVQGKIANCQAVIARLGKNRKQTELLQAASALGLHVTSSLIAESVETLRGIEGAAASTYFSALQSSIPAHWQFNTRERRPPPDPVNAMLSFAYTLCLTKVVSALQLEGLHIGLGVMHVTHGTRPALALDLLEEHRAMCDRIVLRLIGLNQIQPEDFELTALGARLDPNARTTFLEAFEARLNSRVETFDGNQLRWKDSFRFQARLFVKALEQGASLYKPIRVL
jgi:CRISP-associated protein Cas1